jgi:hypothetical protein
MNENVKMIPFTDEELYEMQVTLVDRMMQMNLQKRTGSSKKPFSDSEYETVSRISQRVSHHCKLGKRGC